MPFIRLHLIIITCLIGRQSGKDGRMSLQYINLLMMNQLQYKLYFCMCLRKLAMMGRHFKYILRYFRHYFKNNVVAIIRKMSTLHIHIRGTYCI